MRWTHWILIGALLGCSPEGYTEGDQPGGNGGTGGSGGAAGQGGGGGGMCAPTGPMIDPATLPSCCMDGAAHCVPANLVPASYASALAPCQGGSCVPDKFIRARGALQPAACASVGGAQGVCLSLCIPQVAQYRDLLPRANCDADERCAPCINPLNMMPSGACNIGRCEGQGGSGGTGGTGGGGGTMQCPYTGPPLIDPNTLPGCRMAGGAHCVGAQLVPPAQQTLLAPCQTPQGPGFCAPDPFIRAAGQYVPPNCTSLINAEGRCLSTCIPKVAQQASFLPQATCAMTEKCVPCFSPLDGMPTGACNIACDTGPRMPAQRFPNCRDNRGKCVPTAAIPMTLQENLDDRGCADGNLCVPTENLQPTFAPPACIANGFLVGTYTGVCLSDCLDFGFRGIFLARGNCTADHKCVPCRDPLSGQPTGAPGCPP